MKGAAGAAGFHEVGIARAGPLDPGPLDRMLARGADADMVWLGRQRAERLDPARLLPGVRSVVALALSYLEDTGEPEPAHGRVARYARGRDYHGVMKRRLKDLVGRLRARDPEVRTYHSSDLAPVMEKAWAERAGVGWVGKNGCLITPRFGSWVLLATVLLDRELEPDSPHPERCGSCAACLPACPTGAIVEPGFVDARRCISFQTIERRGPIPEEVAERLGPWVFGCDDCQTVCPWNRAPLRALRPGAPRARGPARPRPRRAARAHAARVPAPLLRHGARRARFEGLVRNAILAAGHAGEARRLPAIEAHLASEFPGVREAARWAAARLEAAERLSAPR